MSENAQPPSSKYYRQLEPGFIRTDVLQRRSTSKNPWWREAVINEVAGVLDEEGARLLEKCVFFIARMGFTAVLFRPAHLDLESDTSALESLIAAAHRVGLKAIVRVCGSDNREWTADCSFSAFYGFEQNSATVVRRARIALQCGADGIDLGRIENQPGSEQERERAENFTQLTRTLLAELAEYSEDHILGASATVGYSDAFRRHMEEEWLHHLCDDRLQKVAFSAPAIEAEVRQNLRLHSEHGSVCAWRATLLRPNHSLGVECFYPGSWEDGADEQRRSAMRLQLAALPGAIYLPFGFSGGHFSFEGANIRPYPPESETELARVQHTTLVLRMRAQYQLANSAFGIVNNLPWATGDCLVLTAGPLMVVLNTGAESVFVPGEHELLVRSESTRVQDSPASKVIFKGEDLQVTYAQKQDTEVPAGTTSWFLC